MARIKKEGSVLFEFTNLRSVQRWPFSSAVFLSVEQACELYLRKEFQCHRRYQKIYDLLHFHRHYRHRENSSPCLCICRRRNDVKSRLLISHKHTYGMVDGNHQNPFPTVIVKKLSLLHEFKRRLKTMNILPLMLEKRLSVAADLLLNPVSLSSRSKADSSRNMFTGVRLQFDS